MQYYLDLEFWAESMFNRHGLIPISRETAESMVANDDRLELAFYDVEGSPFMTVRAKQGARK